MLMLINQLQTFRSSGSYSKNSSGSDASGSSSQAGSSQQQSNQGEERLSENFESKPAFDDAFTHMRILSHFGDRNIRRDIYLPYLYLPLKRMMIESVLNDNKLFTNFTENFRETLRFVWFSKYTALPSFQDDFSNFLVKCFVDSHNADVICSDNTIVQTELSIRLHGPKYTTTTRECWMFHWSNKEFPEADRGTYDLHSNPFWEWSGQNLCVIKIPINTKLIALDKYSEFYMDDKLNGIRRKILIDNLHTGNTEYVLQDKLPDVLKVFDRFNVNNTHREFRLHESAEFIPDETRPPFQSTYHLPLVAGFDPIPMVRYMHLKNFSE